MAVYISGFHAIEEALLSSGASSGSVSIEALLIAGTPGPRVRKLLDLAGKRGIRTIRSDDKELARLSGVSDHRGVLLAIQQAAAIKSLGLDEHLDLLKARIEELRQSAELSKSANRLWPCILALDSITDPHNLGAILRSADKFGVDLVLLPQRRSAQETETVRNSSAGASAWVQTVAVGNLNRAVEQCRDAGFWICGADMEGTPAHRFAADRPLVVIMGSEGKGIGRLLSEHCDEMISIPCTGHVDSLNVSVATAILLYEIRRQQDFSWNSPQT